MAMEHSNSNNNNRGCAAYLDDFTYFSTSNDTEKSSNEQSLLFQEAIRVQKWEFAASLIVSSDARTLNHFLCRSAEFIWFVRSRNELERITELIRKIVFHGGCKFMRAVVTCTFVAACVAVYENLETSLENIVFGIAQNLQNGIKKSKRDASFKAEARERVQRFTKWALKGIEIHHQSLEDNSKRNRSTITEVQLQLSAFKSFLDLAGTNLSINHYNEAFRTVSYLLTQLPVFDARWSSGISAYLMEGLLRMLVEGGANDINLSLLVASRLGCTELVRAILQIAQQKNLAVNVELAFLHASLFGKLATMECLFEEGQATTFLKPLCAAAKLGCLPVIQWFLSHGCQNSYLTTALVMAASSNQVEIATYLLHHIPPHFIASKSLKIIKFTYKFGGDSLHGVSLLLHLNFLRDSSATYRVANYIARSEDETWTVDQKLKAFLQEQWSEEAFMEGMKEGKDHYVNLMRILKRGESDLCLRELPSPLSTAIACLPLYRECVAANGQLLPQRLRGELVEVTGRLSNGAVNEGTQFNELMAVLKNHLPFFVRCS